MTMQARLERESRIAGALFTVAIFAAFLTKAVELLA